jgi:hypothetical protein
MFDFFKKHADRRKLQSVRAEIAVEMVTVDRLTARAQDSIRMDFKPYCEKWGADYDGLMVEARTKVARDLAEGARRRADLRALGIR